MLQIRIHKDQGIAIGMVQSGGHGRLMTEVPGKAEKPNMHRILCRQLPQNLQCAIPGAVIHKQEAVVPAQRSEFRAAGACDPVEFRKPGLLIVGRNHYA